MYLQLLACICSDRHYGDHSVAHLHMQAVRRSKRYRAELPLRPRREVLTPVKLLRSPPGRFLFSFIASVLGGGGAPGVVRWRCSSSRVCPAPRPRCCSSAARSARKAPSLAAAPGLLPSGSRRRSPSSPPCCGRGAGRASVPAPPLVWSPGRVRGFAVATASPFRGRAARVRWRLVPPANTPNAKNAS